MQYRGIYAITSASLLVGDDLLPAVQAALDGGIALLQYRAKGLPPETCRQQAEALKKCCDEYAVPLIVNDDIELCVAVGAAGIHLGQQDAPVTRARERVGPEPNIGVSCHDSIESAQLAQEGGASYVAFGRFFPSTTKPGAPPARPDTLRLAKRTLDIPVVAIGGINPENGASLIDAGADMLAAVDSIFGAGDVYAQTRRLVSLFEHSRQGRS